MRKNQSMHHNHPYSIVYSWAEFNVKKLKQSVYRTENTPSVLIAELDSKEVYTTIFNAISELQRMSLKGENATDEKFFNEQSVFEMIGRLKSIKELTN